MRFMFDEYGGVIINAMVATMLSLLFFNTLYPAASSAVSQLIENNLIPENVVLNDEVSAPTLYVSSCVIPLHTSFDYHNYSCAYSANGKNISSQITLFKGEVNTSKPGKYEIILKVTYKNVSTYKTAVYLVEGLE